MQRDERRIPVRRFVRRGKVDLGIAPDGTRECVARRSWKKLSAISASFRVHTWARYARLTAIQSGVVCHARTTATVAATRSSYSASRADALACAAVHSRSSKCPRARRVM